jgi:hypothetical protein
LFYPINQMRCKQAGAEALAALVKECQHPVFVDL